MRFSLVILLICLICCTTAKNEDSVADTTSSQDDTDSTTAITLTTAPPQSLQIVDTTTFGKFMTLFDSPGSEIPEDILTALSINPDGMGRYTSKEVLENDLIIFVLFTHMKMVGGGLDELHAATFLKDGTVVEDILIGSSYDNGPDGGEDYNYRYDAPQKILYVTNSNHGWDEETQQEVTKEVVHSFQLARDGKLVDPTEYPKESEREYPEVSERLLEKGELSTKTKEELMIMRNEPFAAYGYIFKNKFLKNYFDSKEWYDPRFENVNERLSEIEKKNIKLIKQVEEIK